MATPTGKKMARQAVGKRSGDWASFGIFEEHRGGVEERKAKTDNNTPDVVSSTFPRVFSFLM